MKKIFINYFKIVIYLVVISGLNISHAGSYEDFFRAVRRDDASAIQQLLKRGFDANTVDEEGRTGLSIALKETAVKVSGVMVDWPQTDINMPNRLGETPLMLAAVDGQMELATKMIKKGADVNKTGWTPLHYAASRGQVEMISLLLENSAYIDAQSPNGTTPLMMAAMYGSTESLNLLLKEGADPSLKNQKGLTALQFAVDGDRPDAIKILGGLRLLSPRSATVTAPVPSPPKIPAPAPSRAPAPKAETVISTPYWTDPAAPTSKPKPISTTPAVPAPAPAIPDSNTPKRIPQW